jgi:hypothetical protein
MCFYNDEFPQVWREDVSTARKQHKCDGGCTINKGEKYWHGFGVMDCTSYTMKMCRRCAFDYARVVAGELLEGCDWAESMPPNLDEALEWLAEHNCGRTKSESVPEGFNLDDWPHGAVEFVKAIPGIVATLTEDEESIA